MAENSEAISQEPNWSRMVMQTEGKGGRYHSMFTKEGQEFASQKWKEFLGTIPEASFDEIKEAVREYKEDTKDKYDGIKKVYRNLLVRSFEARVNHLEIVMLGEQVNSLLSQWGGELDQVINDKYPDKNGFGRAKTLKEKRDYLLTLEERIAKPSRAQKPARDIASIEGQDITVPPGRKLNRYQKIKAAVAGIAAGVAIWAVLHGSFDKGRKPVEDKSAPTGIPTVVAELLSPTAEAALQTEHPIEIATQTETLEPTHTSTPSLKNTDLPTLTLTERPTVGPNATLTESPTQETTATVEPAATATTTETPTEEPTATQEFTPTEPPARFESHVPSPELQGLADVIINNSNNPYYGEAYGRAERYQGQDLPQVFKDAFLYGYTASVIKQLCDLYGSDINAVRDGLVVYTSDELNNYLREGRGGSTATTPLAIKADGEVEVKDVAIDSNATISLETATEEVIQGLQYNEFAELFNSGYLADVAGIDTPEKFAQALTNGNMRAMLELVQQQFLAENGVHGNSYNFLVTGMDNPSSVWDVNTPFNTFVAQISAVTGKSYTASDLMDAAKLRGINEIFRQNTGGRNIWELTGMSRENVIIAAPMHLDPSIAVAQGG